MKKIFTVFLITILVTFLYGCPAKIEAPEFDSTPIGEMLFQLQENISVVSEEFTFTTDESGNETSWFYDVMDLNLKYTLQNDNEMGVNVDLYYPILSTNQLELMDESNIPVLKVDGQMKAMGSHLGFVDENFLDFHNYTYASIDELIVQPYEYRYSDLIHVYEFTAPKKGEDQDLTIVVPEGTKILTDYYYSYSGDKTSYQNGLFEYKDNIMTIKAFEEVTTGRFYTINNEATFVANYDVQSSQGIGVPLSIFAEHRCYNEYCEALMVEELSLFIESDILSKPMREIVEASNYTREFMSVFYSTVWLKGNGSQTEIEINIPIQAGAYSITRSVEENGYTRNIATSFLYYDFYLDTERYVERNIYVSINIISNYEMVSINKAISDEFVLINLPNEDNHIYFDLNTKYETELN